MAKSAGIRKAYIVWGISWHDVQYNISASFTWVCSLAIPMYSAFESCIWYQSFCVWWLCWLEDELSQTLYTDDLPGRHMEAFAWCQATWWLIESIDLCLLIAMSELTIPKTSPVDCLSLYTLYARSPCLEKAVHTKSPISSTLRTWIMVGFAWASSTNVIWSLCCIKVRCMVVAHTLGSLSYCVSSLL